MYVDADASGKLMIADLTTDQMLAIQIAALAISESQDRDTDQSRFLRRLAMDIDKINKQLL